MYRVEATPVNGSTALLHNCQHIVSTTLTATMLRVLSTAKAWFHSWQ